MSNYEPLVQKISDLIDKLNFWKLVTIYDGLMPIFNIKLVNTIQPNTTQAYEVGITLAYALGKGYDLKWPESSRTWESMGKDKEDDQTRGGTFD